MMTENQKMAADNIALAHTVAHRFQSTGIEFEELKSLAYLGLVKAANAFDSTKGCKFSTLATTVMNNEILYFLRGVRKHSKVTMSLDAETIVDEDCTLKDIIPDTRGGDSFTEMEWIYHLQNNLKSLNKTERKVLEAKISNQELTQAELGAMLGMSQSYLSRVLASVKKKIVH